MGRFDLFEFEDQKWFPEVIRNCITDLLDFSARKLDFYKPVFPIIKKALEKSEKKVIIDFCSGSSGGILKINEYLKKNYEQNFNIILTDLEILAPNAYYPFKRLILLSREFQDHHKSE